MARMSGLSRWLINRRTVTRADRVLREVSGSLTLPDRPRLLELGMGGGGLVALGTERFRPALYVGTDVDPEQVRSAREFLSARFGTIPSPVLLSEVDALKLPFKDQSFDGVFALMSLHHVERHHGEFVQQPTAVGEIRRVLRPGGWLVYKDFSRGGRLRRTIEDLGFRRVALRSHVRTETGLYRSTEPEIRAGA